MKYVNALLKEPSDAMHAQVTTFMMELIRKELDALPVENHDFILQEMIKELQRKIQ